MCKKEKRVTAVLHYIEKNLDDRPKLERLWEQFHLSKFHFQRQLRAELGISLLELIRQLRFKRAAYQLVFRPELKIVDIALAAGFDSHEGFSRAFKNNFTLSPSQFRNEQHWQVWLQKYDPIQTLKEKHMPDDTDVEVEVVNFKQIKVACFEHKGAPHTLPASIQQFIQWRRENALPPARSRTFNLIYDDPRLIRPEDYRLAICCEIKQDVHANNHQVFEKAIPGGLCAKVRHIGSDDMLGRVVDYLYSHWLPEQDYSLRDFPLFFERLRFFPDVPEHQSVTDIYLPLQ